VAGTDYSLTSTLCIPFSGGKKKQKDNCAFNFHLSQLRIKIDQAFNLMVNKGSVFKKQPRSGLKGCFIRWNIA
jgi:hypothetical protein